MVVKLGVVNSLSVVITLVSRGGGQIGEIIRRQAAGGIGIAWYHNHLAGAGASLPLHHYPLPPTILLTSLPITVTIPPVIL